MRKTRFPEQKKMRAEDRAEGKRKEGKPLIFIARAPVLVTRNKRTQSSSVSKGETLSRHKKAEKPGKKNEFRIRSFSLAGRKVDSEKETLRERELRGTAICKMVKSSKFESLCEINTQVIWDGKEVSSAVRGPGCVKNL